MRLYDNAYSSVYEEFKTYYPVWYRDVLEMDAIWQAYGIQMDDAQKGISQAVNNNFIMKTDAANIAKLERFLYITYDGARTLNERRTMVASFVIGHGHFGEREIKEILSLFTDGEVSVDLIGGTVEISVTREISDRFNLSDCLFIMHKRIPAHLGLVFRENLLPIRFANERGLKFHSFGAHTRFLNRGRPLPILLDGQRNLDGSWLLDQAYQGIGMPSVAFSTSFNGSSIKPILLDGRHILDGTWILDQNVGRKAQNTAKTPSIAFSSFLILNEYQAPINFSAVIGAENKQAFEGNAVNFRSSHINEPSRAGIPALSLFPTLSPNIIQHKIEGLAVNAGLHNKQAAKNDTVQIDLQTKQEYSFGGEITMDSMYTLDGSVPLDGSRKLNAQIVKEVI